MSCSRIPPGAAWFRIRNPRLNAVLAFSLTGRRCNRCGAIGRPVDLSRKTYVTPFKLILFTLLALFFAAIVLWRRRARPARRRDRRSSGCSPPAGSPGRLLELAQPHAQTGCARNASRRPYCDHHARRRHQLRRDDGRSCHRATCFARIAVSSRKTTRTASASRHAVEVIVSGGNPQRQKRNRSRHLSALPAPQTGAARKDIVLENRSRTTYENARNVVRHSATRSRYDSLILVTSALPDAPRVARLPSFRRRRRSR